MFLDYTRFLIDVHRLTFIMYNYMPNTCEKNNKVQE